MITRTALGEVIDNRLTDLNMRRDTFINRVGISKAHLSDIINGNKMPSLIMLIDIATGLNMPTSELLHRAETLHEQAQRVEAVWPRPPRLPQHQGRP